MKLLVTGATGFVGSGLLQCFATTPGIEIVATTRRVSNTVKPGTTFVCVGDLFGATDWTPLLSGVDVVVHLAARVHVMRDTVSDPLGEFRRINTEATLNLARQAAAAAVGRCVFLSSIKVNGEATSPSRPLRADDAAAPHDPYAVSKFEAEQGLQAVDAETGMRIATIRPPLVYGPGVGANFRRLMGLAARGIPLPVGGVRNARSLVSVWNLCDLIRTLVAAPSATSGVFMVSDGEDLSTADLMRRISRFMGRRARVPAVPLAMLKAVGRLTGRGDEVARLTDSLTVDIADTRRRLEWTPPLSVDVSLERTVRWYLGEGSCSVR